MCRVCQRCVSQERGSESTRARVCVRALERVREKERRVCVCVHESKRERYRERGRQWESARARARRRERNGAREGEKQRALTHAPSGEKAEVLPIALEVTAPDTAVYIRLHRRQGTHRVLSPVSLSCSRVLESVLRRESVVRCVDRQERECGKASVVRPREVGSG